MLAKIIKADKSNNDANTAALINVTLHSMFREIGLELNGRNVGDTSHLYSYRSLLETLLNFSKETETTRYWCEGSTKKTTGHMDVTAVGGNNAGLNASAATFAKSTVVELIGRPHIDVFHLERLIFPNIDIHMKLMPSSKYFVCKSVAPGWGAHQ